MKYKIKLPGFEHLVFEGTAGGGGLWVSKVETENTGQTIPHGMWVSDKLMEQIREERDYGDELYHAEFHKGGIDVAYARYQNVATVSVRETGHIAGAAYERTLYAQNFWDEKADEAIKAVERVMRDGLDPDDLILELKENE